MHNHISGDPHQEQEGAHVPDWDRCIIYFEHAVNGIVQRITLPRTRTTEQALQRLVEK